MWVEKRHSCNLPYRVHHSLAKMGKIFECDHCKREWEVVGVSRVNEFYSDLLFEYRSEGHVHIRQMGPV